MAKTSLQQLLDGGASGRLQKIIQNAQKMEALTLRLRAALEPAMAEHVLAANVRDDGQLVVICDSSAWAARLRYESDRLMAAARADGARVERCRIKVSG